MFGKNKDKKRRHLSYEKERRLEDLRKMDGIVTTLARSSPRVRSRYTDVYPGSVGAFSWSRKGNYQNEIKELLTNLDLPDPESGIYGSRFCYASRNELAFLARAEDFYWNEKLINASLNHPDFFKIIGGRGEFWGVIPVDGTAYGIRVDSSVYRPDPEYCLGGRIDFIAHRRTDLSNGEKSNERFKDKFFEYIPLQRAVVTYRFTPFNLKPDLSNARFSFTNYVTDPGSFRNPEVKAAVIGDDLPVKQEQATGFKVDYYESDGTLHSQRRYVDDGAFGSGDSFFRVERECRKFPISQRSMLYECPREIADQVLPIKDLHEKLCGMRARGLKP